MLSFPPLPLCTITSFYCRTPKMLCNITSFYCLTPKMLCTITSFYCRTPKMLCTITSFYCWTPKMQCNITSFYCRTPKDVEVDVKPCKLLKVTSFASLSYRHRAIVMGQQAHSRRNGTKSTGQRALNMSVLGFLHPVNSTGSSQDRKWDKRIPGQKVNNSCPTCRRTT